MPKIEFISEIPGWDLPEHVTERLSEWIVGEIMSLQPQKKLHSLTYIFMSDEQLIEINRNFLQHDDYTDIITFDNCRGISVSGEMYISLERMQDNARTLGQSYPREFLRLLGHGLLHLLGQKDKTVEDAQEMRRKEEIILESTEVLQKNLEPLFPISFTLIENPETSL